MDISVVIPMHNREKTICKCVMSVLSQTYKPVEIIVVDDCSTDNSVQELEKLNNELIKVIRSDKNYGAQHARNIGIKAAKGDWIAFHDSDDIWFTDKLEKQVNAIERTGYKLSAGGALVKSKDREYEWFCKGESGYIFDEIMSLSTYVFFPTLLVRKDCFEKIGYLDEAVVAYQELDTAIRLLKDEKMAYVCEPLFEYSLMENNSISKNRTKGIKGRQYIYDKFYETINNNVLYKIAWYRAFAGDYGYKSLQFYNYCLKWLVWNIIWLGRKMIGKK